MCVAAALLLPVLPSLPSLPCPASLQRVFAPPPPLISRQPAKTIYIDNQRIWFANDEDFQLALTRVGAAGVIKVPAKGHPSLRMLAWQEGVDPVEDVVCRNLAAISDGQFYTYHPPLLR